MLIGRLLLIVCSVANHIWEWPMFAKFAALPCAIGVKPSLRVLLNLKSSFARSVRTPGACFGP